MSAGRWHLSPSRSKALAGAPAAANARLLFYVGVPALTALLFGLNQAGMARVLPRSLAVPYWLGLTMPLWILLDGCSRAVHFTLRPLHPHRWLVLLTGSLIAMALFSPYVTTYAGLFNTFAQNGAAYVVSTPFPEAFLDLRRFVSFSGVPIYWICVALFFARYFRFPAYLILDGIPAAPAARGFAGSPTPLGAVARDIADPPMRVSGASPVAEDDDGGLLHLLPRHIGTDVLTLQAEDHYVRVVTAAGNALVRYRFSDALAEVRALPGIQVHRSHWVALRAIERVRNSATGLSLELVNGIQVPVSRTNVGVLKTFNLM